MIDFHMHIGRLFYSESKSLTPSYLLKLMDEHGIEKAVLLPIENPEETDYYITTDYVLRICKRFPDRFIPFCNIDPRRRNSDTSTDFYGMLKQYKERGCKGFGEVLPGLYIDDPRLQMIYEACGKLDMPIAFHLDALRSIDEKGLPRFEAMIRKFPDTIFVGHGQHFWAEISSDVKESEFGAYPPGPVKRIGAAEHLLATYPNAYADLSAGSGYNAVSRDPEFGKWFLERYYEKLLFGTDICRRGPIPPMLQLIKDAGISDIAYSKITRLNAERLLHL
ncbi:MAG: amidohydrolase family protein [Armatimonadota bacterium]